MKFGFSSLQTCLSLPRGSLVGLFAVAMLTQSAAEGGFTTFITTPGATLKGLRVNAGAEFITSKNKITLVLHNFAADPRSVIQNLSAFSFTVSTGQKVGRLKTSSGKERTVNSDRNFTDGPVVSTGWVLRTLSEQFFLRGIGAGTRGPGHTLIGDPNSRTGKYNHANGSIKTNAPHRPFLHGPLTFTLTVRGVTVNSLISAATFSFGTKSGNNVAGVMMTPASRLTGVPEPSSLIVFGFGALGIVMSAARRRRQNNRTVSAE